MAIKSLLIKDIDRLNKSLGGSINYIDIDYDIKRSKNDPWTTKTRSTICRNDYAVLNAYRLWLQSKKYDYIRAPSFGGLFENNLNDKVYFSAENEGTVRQLIIDESNQKWPDITILDCEVKAIMSNREWNIKIICQDKNSKMILRDENINIASDD